MGGADLVVANRKRKRKTRSERNHLLRHPHMDQSKHGDKSLPRKSDNVPNSSSYYSLRSSSTKGNSLPATRDVRTCRTITQGRLTKGLSLFSLSKSSDCITRGPIPETESVKKKVEEDLRRIINPSASPIIGCKGDVRNQMDKVVLPSDDGRNKSGSVGEHDGHKSNQNSLSTLNANVEPCNKITTAVQTAPSLSCDSHTKETAKTSSKSNLSTSSSAASVDTENDLAEVLPVNEIADKILQNLKADFETIFPKRDVNKELNSDLQKLLRQSSKRFTDSNNKVVSSASNSLSLLQNEENTGLQRISPELMIQQSTSSPVAVTSPPRTVTQSTSRQVVINPVFQFVSSAGEPQLILSSSTTRPETLSTFPSNILEQSKSVSFHLQDNYNISEIQNGTNHQVLNAPIPQSSSSSCLPATKSKTSAGFFLPNACGDPDAHDSNPIIINIHSDNDADDSDKDQDSGFAVVRYNAFLASARSLKAKLQQQNEKEIYRRLHPSSGCEADSCFLPPSHQKSTHCLPLRHDQLRNHSDKYLGNNNNIVNRFQFSDQCSALTCNQYGSKPLSTFGTRTDNTASFTFPYVNHRSSRSLHQCQPRSRMRLPFSHFSDQSETFPGPSHLAQSRHRLKTALESTFVAGHTRSQSLISERNRDLMDWQDVDILPSTGHFQSHSTSFLRQPLEDLQDHQSDMQHQARNFLDDLECDVSEMGHDTVLHRHQHGPSSSFCPRSSSPNSSSWL